MPRQNFMTGTIYRGQFNPQRLESKSYRRQEEIPSFKAPEPIDRLPMTPDKLQAMELDKEGIRVKLGEQSFEGVAGGIEAMLFGYDKNDTIEEKKKKKADLLASLKNRASSQQLNTLLAHTARVIAGQQLTYKELVDVKKLIEAAKLPKDYRKAVGHRIFTYEEYVAQQGLIDAFILNTTPIKDLQEPIEVFDIDMKTNKLMLLKKIGTQIIKRNLKQTAGRLERYLDVEERRIYPRVLAINMINRSIDGGILNGRVMIGGKKWPNDDVREPPYLRRGISMPGSFKLPPVSAPVIPKP